MNKDPKHPRDPDEEASAALEYMRSIANDCHVPDWLSRMLNGSFLGVIAAGNSHRVILLGCGY